jgi:hypothetical protein
MRMRFVGMQNERITMLQCELLPREVSNGSEHFVRRRSRRHREHEFVNKLRRLPTVGRFEIALSTRIVDVEIPVLDQQLAGSTRQPLAVVSLDFQFPLSADVVEMPGCRLEVVAVAPKDLHHHFWRPLNRPPNLFDLLAG